LEIGSTFPFRGGRETIEGNKKLSPLSCKHSVPCGAHQERTEGEVGAEERGLGEMQVGITEHWGCWRGERRFWVAGCHKEKKAWLPQGEER
jgi:hypothetical protein